MAVTERIVGGNKFEHGGDPGGGYDAVVERALANAGVKTSTPIDGGWGADMAEGYRGGVSYAGEEPSPSEPAPKDFRGFPTMP